MEEFPHLGVDAAVAQRPRFTRVLTHGTHDGGVGFTDLPTEETRSRRGQLGSRASGDAPPN